MLVMNQYNKSSFDFIHISQLFKNTSILQRRRKRNTSNITSNVFSVDMIGIRHEFSCINVCQVPRVLLKAEAYGRGFQQPRGTWRMLMN